MVVGEQAAETAGQGDQRLGRKDHPAAREDESGGGEKQGCGGEDLSGLIRLALRGEMAEPALIMR